MEGRVFRNNYKGHTDKTKGEMASGEEGMDGGKCRQLYLNNNKKIITIIFVFITESLIVLSQ